MPARRAVRASDTQYDVVRKHNSGPLEQAGNRAVSSGRDPRQRNDHVPMPGDDVTLSVTRRPQPSHHAGPGYVTNPKAPGFELDDSLRDTAARWLNLVPAEHRRDGRESAKDTLQTLREHMRSCRDHPLRALWVAHRHLMDPVPAIRIASLVLASEALWWLGHFEDARKAAQAAADADPTSAQALWRLAVALYRQGRFDEAGERLDNLLRLVDRFAPGWALRGQVKVWLDADNPDAGRSDFAAAAALTPDSGTWIVPYRIGRADFEAAADQEIGVHDRETGGSSGVPLDTLLLPEKSLVENGVDPDHRWRLVPGAGISDAGDPFGPLGGDFAPGERPRIPFGTRFVLYQRNIENLCKDKATLCDEIRKSVAELYDAAHRLGGPNTIKGAPEQHAETADAPGDAEG
jgi:tetratricopeptide (TPR) repeat protein